MARFAFGGASAQTHTFTNSPEVSITHGLGHQPLVSVIVNNKMCWADVTYDDTQVVIRFQNSTTGIIVLR